MGRYGELDNDKNEILMQIYKSQEIAKLMTIQNDPLSLTTPNIANIPLALKDIVKTAYIFPTTEDVGCKLIILFRDIQSRDKSKYFTDCLIDIHILVHQTWWDIKTKNRAFQIADFIETVLTGNTKLSMGGLKSIGGNGTYDIGSSNPFKGFNIRFKSTDMNYRSGM